MITIRGGGLVYKMLKPLAHQIETIENLDINFSNNKNKNMVVLPSGSGKTHTIAFHVDKIKPKSFLYIVHRNEILYQTVKIFKDICGKWLKDTDIGIINQENKDYARPYLFATIQTISRKNNLERIDPNIGYVVVDEYHHAAAATYQNVLDVIQPKFFVGLTATPYRLDKKDIHEYVDNNIANEIDLFEGIEKNMLVPFNYVGLYDNIDYSDIEFNGYSYNVSDLDRKLIIAKRDIQVLKEYNERIKMDGRLTIAFCNSVNHVNRMVSLFAQNGISTTGITHKEKYEIRQEKLEKFKQGKYSIIFTRDILNEGVDFPECSAIMFLRPTISKTIFFQQLGRGLRRNKGKKNVLVLDYIGNYYRAFSKKEWLFKYTKGTTGENIKPEYRYELPGNASVWFESRVVEIMELQERNYTPRKERSYPKSKDDLYNDYIRVCDLEKKPRYYLSSPEYRESKYAKFSLTTLYSYFGSFRNFIDEYNIPYDFKTNEKSPFYQERNKQKLIENYYEVKKEWIKQGLKNRNDFISNYVSATFLDNKTVSKNSSVCYRAVWGQYINFIKEIGEYKPFILDFHTQRMTKEEKLENVKNAYWALAKKLGRDYITDTDWRKEYHGLAKVTIDKELGGFPKLRESIGAPSYLTFKCVVCDKDFKTKVVTNLSKCCSDRCRYRYDWRKTKGPRKRKERLERLTGAEVYCKFCKERIDIVKKNKINIQFCSLVCNSRFKYREKLNREGKVIQKHRRSYMEMGKKRGENKN
jgi:superfamily II DNA or RNA helicase